MKITKELVVPNYGIEGTQGKDGLPAIYTTVTNQNIVLNAPYQGLPSDYSKANGSIQVFEGDKEVTQQATYTLKQTLNTAATLDFNKFKVTHMSADNGMFVVTVSYKEFVSDIMITTNVVRNGQKGDNGQDGVGVKSTVIRYAINPQGDTPPSTGWVSQVPTLIKGQFLWTETTWTYTDNTSEKGYSVTYISKDGNNGTDGIAGKDGVGIKNTTFKYGVSTSGTTKPSNWSTTIPTVPEGQFLWTETTWTYTDNTSEKGYSVAKQGAKGPKGDKGPQGDNGQDGPPTGIIESPTIPTEVYQGMLWKNTGNLSGFITDVTYIYRGSKWENYIFTADNIYADNLSAITANLGDVTGGSFTGSKFINNYDSHYIGDTWQRGSLRIEDGVLKDESEYYNKTTGNVTNTNTFYTLHSSLEQSSTSAATGQHQVAQFSSGGIVLFDSVFSGHGYVNLTYEDLMVIEPTILDPSINFKRYASTGPMAPSVSRNGRNIQLYGAFSNLVQLESSASVYHLITVLPDWARPRLRVNFVVQGSNANIHLITINPDGAVLTSRYSKGGVFTPYAVNTWCNITCNYVAGDIDTTLI